MKVLYAYITCFILATTFALPESTLELARLLDFNHSSHESPLTEASNITDDEFLQESCSLPWNLSRNSYRDLSDHVFRSLLQCPEDLHGCSEDLPICHRPDIYVITCSCAPNCVVYGDCCWNVVEPPEMSAAELPRTACVSVKAEVTERQVEFHPRFGAVSLYPKVSGTVFLHMVVGCPASWPRNDVRKACEEYGSFEEIFYSIPVTTDRDVTYRNAFCALCNSDNVDGALWDTVLSGNRVVLLLPSTVFTKPAHHLRPCTDDTTIYKCSQEVPEMVSRRCAMYYAPVRNSADGTVFKNVYCALCNGANTSRLSCGPVLYLESKSSVIVTDYGPNLAALFRPVTTTPACRAFYNGRCYIPRSADLREEDLNSRNNENNTPKTQLAEGASELWSPKNFGVANCATLACLSLSIFCLVLKIFIFCV